MGINIQNPPVFFPFLEGGREGGGGGGGYN